jgi:hypothetical protein
LRPLATAYSLDAATAQMGRLLARHPHITQDEAFRVLEAYR